MICFFLYIYLNNLDNGHNERNETSLYIPYYETRFTCEEPDWLKRFYKSLAP